MDADALGVDNYPRTRAMDYVPLMLSIIGQFEGKVGLPHRRWRCELCRAGFCRLCESSVAKVWDELRVGERGG